MIVWFYITSILLAFVPTSWANSTVELEKETSTYHSDIYNKIILSKYECGGHFKDLTGSITSPNYPNFHTNGMNCTYVIGERSNYVTLEFDKLFSIKGHGPCGSSDYVEIYQVEMSDANSQGKYCGDTAPAHRTLNGPAIVRIVSGNVPAAYRFKLLYDILDCGAVYTNASGIIGIKIPVRNESTECSWRIVAPENYVIQFRFLTFNLEKKNWLSKVVFYDGNSTSSPRIQALWIKGPDHASKRPPPTVKSSDRDLTVLFKSDVSSHPPEFSARYHVAFGEAQGCGGRLNSTSGTIAFSEPLEPTTIARPEVLDCVWLIIADEPDQAVTLTYESFNMRAARNGSCTDDFLEIREDSSKGPVLGTYCGNQPPEQQSTSAAAVSVHFRSHKSGPAASFRLRYAVTTSPCGPSNLIATPEPQTITSPGYPNPYLGNIKCRWILKINQTIERSDVASAYVSPIAMSITDMDIPCGGDDYLEITRGFAFFKRPESFRFCGDKPPQLEQAEGVMQITFNSKASGHRGFSLTYRTTSCNTTYSDDNGVVYSDSFPLRSSRVEKKCSFGITAPEGHTVALYFNHFTLGFGYTSGNCGRDYVKVHDGFGESSPVIESFCGEYLEEPPNPVFSSGRSLFVDNASFGYGLTYSLTYTTTDKGRGCGGRFNSARGSFSSPLYPLPHRGVPGECVWHVSVPGQHLVLLRFTSFALANSTEDANYLEVYEGPAVRPDKKIARFGGTDIPGELELSSSEATLRLVTDFRNDQRGFYAYFEPSELGPVDVPVKVAQNFYE